MMKEINTIRYDKITAAELKQAKAEYVGSFVINVQKPATVARYALNRELYNLPDDFYENYLANINAVTIDDVQNAAIKYFTSNKARIVITGKGIDVLKNLEKTDYIIKYFDDKGNATVKPPMTMPIPEGMTAANVVDSYVKAIGGKDKVMAVKTTLMVANATIQGMPLVMTSKSSAPNKTSQEIAVAGNVMQKSVFDGEKGYQEARGQKMDMKPAQLEEAKSNVVPFSDMAYKEGTLDRIEPIDGENYFVIKYNDSEVFYDMKTGLKAKEVKTAKGPDGKEVKVPTTFSNYKAVNGVLFPHTIGVKSGPMDLKFEVQEVKVNEGVTDADFK